jgi:hypothetical protein
MKLTPQQREDGIAQLEEMLRDKASSYWKGPAAPKLQAELRTLYEARETGREVHTISAHEEEKRGLEEIMYSDRALWNRTPELGARYRELIEADLAKGAGQ